MNKELVILGHSNPDVDSIISGYLLEKILRKAGFQARFIIPDAKIEKQTYTICLKYGVDPKQFMDSLPETYSNYFLVDHCKREVFGKIIGIIDHHPSDISETPSFYVNQTQTSTAMLIFNYGWMYLEPNDEKLVIIANLEIGREHV